MHQRTEYVFTSGCCTYKVWVAVLIVEGGMNCVLWQSLPESMCMPSAQMSQIFHLFFSTLFLIQTFVLVTLCPVDVFDFFPMQSFRMVTPSPVLFEKSLDSLWIWDFSAPHSYKLTYLVVKFFKLVFYNSLFPLTQHIRKIIKSIFFLKTPAVTIS